MVKFLNLYFQKICTFIQFIKNGYQQILNKRLSSLKLAHDIHRRRFRTLDDSNLWKSHDWEIFTLVSSSMAHEAINTIQYTTKKGLLPEPYYTSYIQNYVTPMKLLLKPKCAKQDLEIAKWKLLKFIEECKRFYKRCTLKIHSVAHLVEERENLGNLQHSTCL